MSDGVYRKPVPDTLITLFGRKPVLEALVDPQLQPWRLHLSARNKPASILNEMEALAATRGVEVLRHAPEKLARISRNGRQDQGVALDILSPGYQPAETLLHATPARCRLLACDRIHNPQNLGMIIRSACAGFVDGILLPERETAGLNPLTIKASAGTVFRADIYRCKTLTDILPALKRQGFQIFVLSGEGSQDLLALPVPERAIFVLGNETDGVQAEVMALADAQVRIPMRRNTESLNVAAAATVLSFLPGLRTEIRKS